MNLALMKDFMVSLLGKVKVRVVLSVRKMLLVLMLMLPSKFKAPEGVGGGV